MASVTVSTLFFAFLLVLASFNLPIEGRNIAKDENIETIRPSLSTINSRFHPDTAISVYNIYPAGWRANPGKFHGASAQIGLWPIPDVKPNSTSEYGMAVGKDLQGFIMAGFHVYPNLYKDNDLHFFTYWATLAGRQSTDCYNTRCAGFVVADGATLHPGQVMPPPLSTYNKDDYSIILTIKKDEKTQNWSLYTTSLGKTTLLGWWEKTAFATDSASDIQFAGTAYFNSSEPSPPMGSGHYSKEGEKKAAYFKQITFFDQNGNGYIPSPKDMLPVQDKTGCYTVSSLEETPDHGRMFYYGGPSGCKFYK